MEEQQSSQKYSFPTSWFFQNQSRETLRNRWTEVVLCTLLYIVPSFISGLLPDDNIYWLMLYIGLLCFIIQPLSFGYEITMLNVANGAADNDLITRPYTMTFENYNRYLTTSVFKYFIVLLWTLLLIVPGIVMSYVYAMTSYIMHENPDLSPEECLRRSKQMMQGYKWKLFCLDLSFIAWYLLGIITLGIGMLWISPWVDCAKAKFYQQLKQEATVLQ